jgi:GT2 family glycosyltransferase
MHIKKGFFRKGEFPHRREYYQVDWVEASFFLTRRSLWNILGGLDKNYFMYGEDVDYCRRVRDAGFMTVYCPSVQYLHYGGYGSTRLLDLVKGFIRYHRKFSGRWTRTLALLLLRTSICAKYWCSGVLLMAGKRAEYKMRREALSKVLSGNVWCG